MKLNQFLIMFVLILALFPLMISEYANFKAIEDHIKENAFEKLVIETENKEIQLQTLLTTQIANLQILSSNDNVIKLAEQMINSEGGFLERENSEAYKKLKEDLIRFGDFYGGAALEGGTYTDVMIFDMQGRAWIATYGPDEGVDESKTVWFRNAKHDMYLGDISYNPVMSQTTQIAAIPIRNEEESIVAILQLETNIRVINEILVERSFLGESGETYLVNREKIMLTDSRFVEDASGNQEVDTEGINRTLTTKKDLVLEHLDYRGIPVFALVHFFGSSLDVKNREAQKLIEGLDWVLIGEIDSEEVLQPLKELRNRFMVTVLVLIVIIFLSGYLFTKIISKPLSKLSDTVDEVSKGNFKVEVDKEGNIDEINQLTDSLDRIMTTMKLAIEDKGPIQIIQKTQGVSEKTLEKIGAEGLQEAGLIKKSTEISEDPKKPKKKKGGTKND